MKINPIELDRWIERSDDAFDDPYWEEIYDKGWTAFEDGDDEADVPYELGTEEADTWLNGFKDAKRSEK